MSSATVTSSIKAVLWDFGGVLSSSPFEAFNRLEASRGLPADFVRKVNSTNPANNAWAKMERGEISIDQFGDAFKIESTALGHELDGRDVMGVLSGALRPRMIAALKQVKTRYKVACLTNNMRTGHDAGMSPTPERAQRIAEVFALFDAVMESSKTGLRKPEPAFYLQACSLLSVEPPECVFLDDLGINLKPAAAMGMRTIKVVDPDKALEELGAIVGMTFPQV